MRWRSKGHTEVNEKQRGSTLALEKHNPLTIIS